MSSTSAPEPRRGRPWSLAWRLTLWYAAASFVVVAASVGFLYWSLVSRLESEDDQFLAEKVEIVRVLLRDRAGARQHGAGPDEAGRPVASFYLRVVGADGKVLLRSSGMEPTLPAGAFPEAEEAGAV